MNKSITDGVVFTPPPFTDGLDVWSSGDGTPGSDTYENAANALLVAADQDFGGALELLKTENTQQLRYMGQTPILPGCYLRISTRVKAISGNLPSVRIAGYPAQGNGNRVPGLQEFSFFTTLENYGEVVEISAIVGTGARGGVDLPWGVEPVYGHFGIDLVGPNGGIIRVDDIQIEDVTSVFLRDMVSLVDVVDYGAVGDGTTDDTAAFDAANAAANGRTVFVPDGVYRLESDVTFDTPVKFEGTVSMPDTAVLLLRRNFDLPAYIEAFENEEQAFRKAFQALLNNSDHESLDMGGRKVNVTGPLDMQAAVPDRTSFATRRIIRNGQLDAAASAAWDTEVFNSEATYATSDNRTLTDVTNVAAIPIGSLVEGPGVGREVYVRDKDLSRQEITLNKPLYDAVGRQNYTFSRFKYLLDFSGFDALSKFGISNVELQCNGRSSGILLARGGITFAITDSFISRPVNRGITSIGTGCQGMLVDQCQFLSNEDSLDVPQRVSIGFNVNNNDAKIRNNRATRFRHFGLLGGANNIVTGNHFFQGDLVVDGIRSAGLILASNAPGSIISHNYIDNCFVEWTNEHDPAPDFSGGFSFAAVNITDNVFLSGDVAPWISCIVVKPYGTGHFLNGVTITGNRFRTLNGNIDRVDRVDTTFADLDKTRAKNVTMTGNSFLGVDIQVANPARIDFSQSAEEEVWTIDASERLPFGGAVRQVDSVVPIGALRNTNNVKQFVTPYADVLEGTNQDQAELVWPTAVRGRVIASVRMDSQ